MLEAYQIISEHPLMVILLTELFATKKSDVQVQGQGTVIAILADDNKGTRHQRFIIKLANKQSLLIAHNIDLAPKINDLSIGDFIEFFGEYEWNDKGGIIHWTHMTQRANILMAGYYTTILFINDELLHKQRVKTNLLDSK